ncbi:hemerythrin family protein [Accumulibacter sp.]|uniref:bacteriohemerythrin n=1 Tax=Accumulibacter sp. TaxID=2053492 RepID=UPI00261E4CED|nr:hemerythrin family protein [Accumulibacter sp.]
MDIYLSALLPEALLVDLPEIDAQHEEIFSRIEALKAACFGSSYVPIDEFDSLLELFDQHFATEERIADEARLEFSNHARVHQDTLRLLHRALGEVINGTHDAHSFLRYAEYWFERHISEEDRLFVTTLKSSKYSRPLDRRTAVDPSCPARA